MVSHVIKIEAKLGIFEKELNERKIVKKISSQWTDTAQVMRRASLVLVQIQYELRLYLKNN